jgi:hypothetical protein
MHPDLLGEGLSRSGQRLAQLGSLLASWATVQARRAERRAAASAATSEGQLRELRDQENAARRLARAGWAPAGDRKWLASADLLDTARAWGAAAAWADGDPEAATAFNRCEEQLRTLHPYAMARYDRLRAEGAGPFDAMRDIVPLFARSPNAQPGGPASARRALTAQAGTGAAPGSPWQWADREEPQPASASSLPAQDLQRGTGVTASPARLAADSFPYSAQDAVRATAPDGTRQRPVQAPAAVRRQSPAR